MKYTINNNNLEIKNDDVQRIELELTNTCNLKCPLCYRELFKKDNTKYHRELDIIIKHILSFKNLKYVTLAGPTSEPTLYPYLFELINFLISINVEISLFINGETHDNLYYRKLGLLFNKAKGSIYFTVCGTTQELHSKYRVGSELNNILTRLDLVSKYTSNVTLTWIIFNYNLEDYKKNKMYYKKYNTEIFYTLPVAEHFNLESTIHLPDHLKKMYDKVDKTDFNKIMCSSKINNFLLIDSHGMESPCGLYKLYGSKHCFECSESNSKILRENKIYKLAESENETSEDALRLK